MEICPLSRGGKWLSALSATAGWGIFCLTFILYVLRLDLDVVLEKIFDNPEIHAKIKL